MRVTCVVLVCMRACVACVYLCMTCVYLRDGALDTCARNQRFAQRPNSTSLSLPHHAGIFSSSHPFSLLSLLVQSPSPSLSFSLPSLPHFQSFPPINNIMNTVTFHQHSSSSSLVVIVPSICLFFLPHSLYISFSPQSSN